MLKKTITAILLSSLLLTSTGCYGSFSLTKKMYDWNGTFGDKFVQSAVMWVFLIVPVYEVCTFIDFVALNTIEFWTGSNPLALTSDKETTKEITANGKSYRATMGNNHITISQTSGDNAGRSVTLHLNPETQSWTLSDGTMTTTVATFKQSPANQVQLHYPDGNIVTKKLTQLEVASIYR